MDTKEDIDSSHDGHAASTIKRKVGLRTICVLAGCILIQLALGSFFTFGNMSPYMISYIRNRTDDTDIRNIDGIWVLSVGSFGNCFGMVAAGIIDRHFGPRIATAVGCLVFAGAIACNFFTVKVSLIAVVVCYGFLALFGSSMAYAITVQTAIKWLPQRPTLAAGLTVGGFGGGTLIFNNLITAFINPENLSPDLETDDGERYFTDPDLLDKVPWCFVVLGGTYLGMQLIGLIFITDPPPPEVEVSIGVVNPGLTNSDEGINKLGHKVSEKAVDVCMKDDGLENRNADTDIRDTNTSTNVRTLKQDIIYTLTSRCFYVVFLTVMCIVFSMLFIFSQYKSYGQTFIEDDHFLALAGTISSIFNCLGRPLWGMVMDRFGYRVTIRCISLGLAVTAGTIVLTEHMHKAFFLIWICSGYFFYCGTWAVCPSTLAKLFGVHNTAINYGFINVALGFANLFSGIFGVTAKDLIGWHGIFFIACGINAIPFLISFFFNGVDSHGKRV